MGADVVPVPDGVSWTVTMRADPRGKTKARLAAAS